jgi:aldehyde:ferredoxin oxidoreductase
MMSLGGFAGTVLVVDLTNGEVRKEPLDGGLAKDFIGGLGLTVRLAYENLLPGTDALAPENPIVLGAGPLVGTDLPASSRVFSITKLPTSGTIGWSGAGGVTFGSMLKNAGYDQMVIKGRADRPVYLEIIDDQVALRDASALWGKGVSATCEAFWRDHARPTGVDGLHRSDRHPRARRFRCCDGVQELEGRRGQGHERCQG